MGVRAVRARIECDRETLIHLWRTHRVFNERQPSLITKLFAMRRGEIGTTPEQRKLYQRIARFILARDSKDAPYLLNSVSIKDWTPATAVKMKIKVEGENGADVEVSGETWANEAAALSAQGILAFDKKAERCGLPDSLYQPLMRDAVAYISSHDELVRNWQKEHAEWRKKKAEWETKDENKRYLALRPRFEAFEQSVGGKAGKRRERWHLYLKWLQQNPDLAGWRGGATIVKPLDANAEARVAKAKPWKKRSVEAEEFWRANPELAAVDKLHGYYEREFVRRRKTKKNPDGFDHRPTFTLPHPVLHPRWTLFNGPRTSPNGYRDLILPAVPGERGTVNLRLLTGDKTGDDFPSEWLTVSFRSDPRLAQLIERTETTTFKKGKNKGKPNTKKGFFFIDRQLKRERRAQISGAKLIFDHIKLNNDGSLKSATPYLVFALTIESLPITDRAKAIQWSETGEVTRTGNKRKKKKLPPGLISCAVDLGIRNLGFLTLAELNGDSNDRHGVRLIRSRNQWLAMEETKGKHAGRWSAGPDLAHIAEHKREIRRLRRLRGKPIRGEQSHVQLQHHIECMGDDRFKKAARAIVNFALNVDGAVDRRTGEMYPPADVLLVEKLAGLIPDAERERGINRAIVSWNRGQLVTRIKEMAADAGLKVFEVPPYGTSQLCSKCGALGRRYSVVRDEQTRCATIQFGWVEKLFACPHAGCPGRDPGKPHRPFTCNADHNASVNLHRKFVLGEKFIAENVSALMWDKNKTRRNEHIARIDAGLLPHLERLHRIHDSAH